jgi:hypothetical protein
MEVHIVKMEVAVGLLLSGQYILGIERWEDGESGGPRVISKIGLFNPP